MSLISLFRICTVVAQFLLGLSLLLLSACNDNSKSLRNKNLNETEIANDPNGENQKSTSDNQDKAFKILKFAPTEIRKKSEAPQVKRKGNLDLIVGLAEIESPKLEVQSRKFRFSGIAKLRIERPESDDSTVDKTASYEIERAFELEGEDPNHTGEATLRPSPKTQAQLTQLNGLAKVGGKVFCLHVNPDGSFSCRKNFIDVYFKYKSKIHRVQIESSSEVTTLNANKDSRTSTSPTSTSANSGGNPKTAKDSDPQSQQTEFNNSHVGMDAEPVGDFVGSNEFEIADLLDIKESNDAKIEDEKEDKNKNSRENEKNKENQNGEEYEVEKGDDQNKKKRDSGSMRIESRSVSLRETASDVQELLKRRPKTPITPTEPTLKDLYGTSLETGPNRWGDGLRPCGKDLICNPSGKSRPSNQALGHASSGALRGATNLVEKIDELGGKSVNIRLPRASRKTFFGTFEIVEIISLMAKKLQLLAPGESLWIHDLSASRGSSLGNHRSHENGTGADIAYILNDDSGSSHFRNIVSKGRAQNLNVPAQWHVFKYTVSTGWVDRIFVDQAIKREMCNYSQSLQESSMEQRWTHETLKRLVHRYNGGSLVTGHADHFHLRIACSQFHPRCRNMADPPEPKCPR